MLRQIPRKDHNARLCTPAHINRVGGNPKTGTLPARKEQTLFRKTPYPVIVGEPSYLRFDPTTSQCRPRHWLGAWTRWGARSLPSVHGSLPPERAQSP